MKEEQTESTAAEETDEEKAEASNQEVDEPEDNNAPVKEEDEDVTLPVEEEQESVSENTVEEELSVNSVMATPVGYIASGTSNDISWVIDADGKLTVTGTGMYGGSVTMKFTILQRDVYTAP